MSKKEMFFNLCHIMANMEDAIKTFEKFGMIVEPDQSVGYDMYNAASVAYRIASSLLEFPNVKEENEVFDKVMQANLENVDSIAKEVWEKYGTK
jgi:hypothetical protein